MLQLSILMVKRINEVVKAILSSTFNTDILIRFICEFSISVICTVIVIFTLLLAFGLINK